MAHMQAGIDRSMRKRLSSARGQSATEFVVLLGSITAVSIGVLVMITPSLSKAYRETTECVVSDVCRSSQAPTPIVFNPPADPHRCDEERINSLLRQGAEVCAAMRVVAAKIYDSVDTSVRADIDKNVAVLGLVPVLGTALKVIDGLINIEHAIDASRPIVDGIKPVLDHIFKDFPTKYSVAASCMASIAIAYDAYLRNEYQKSLENLSDCAVVGSGTLIATNVITREFAKQALKTALAKVADSLVDVVYKTFKDTTTQVLELVNRERLSDIHENLVRELGEVNKQLTHESLMCSDKRGPMIC